MLRSVVPPPSPEMILSTLTPSAANNPFSVATAHGSVAVTRPYWLTAISAAAAGTEPQANSAHTAANADRQRFMSSSLALRRSMSWRLAGQNPTTMAHGVAVGMVPSQTAGLVIARESSPYGGQAPQARNPPVASSTTTQLVGFASLNPPG